MGAGSEHGKPIKIVGKVIDFDGTAVATGAENDKVEVRSTADGRLLICLDHPRFNQTYTSYAAATTASALIGAPGASLSLYVQDIHFYSDTACTFTFGQDTASLNSKFIYTAGSGGVQTDRKFSPPLKLSANKNFGVTTTATTTSFFISAFIAP